MRWGLCALAILSASCPSAKKTTLDLNPLLARPGDDLMLDDSQPGFTLKLAEGAPESQRAERLPVAQTTALGEAETNKVLGRLPALVAKDGDTKPFALRDKSLPPPRPGKTVSDAFPPPASGPAPDPGATGPLTVLRHQPDGDVPLAPNLSITFSQPMVAVTSVGELARQAVPVKVTPEPKGKWRWVGTKTLFFEPDGRFPMATEYVVEIPAGTRSAIGGALAKGETFRFRTPAPIVVASHPVEGPARHDPVLFVSFDQKIDPAAVLASIQIGGARLRLATPAEIEKDEAVRRLAKEAEPGRWLAFRPESPLPADSKITVKVGPGTPSAEGGRKTEKAQELQFKTYGALKVVKKQCGWGSECRPLMPFNVEFSNPIDAKRFVKSMVSAEPAMPGLKVEVNDRYMTIWGRTKGRTRYHVTLAAAIPDQFGQSLGEAKTLDFDVGRAEAALSAQGGPFVVLDPAGGARLSVFTVNQKALTVRAWAVSPSDWGGYREFQRRYWSDDRLTTPPGKKVLDTTVKPSGEADELIETRLDLGAAFPGGHGHAVVIVEPSEKPKDRWARQTVITWIQKTDLGIDAFADAGELTAFATRLADGAPLGDVEVTLGGQTARTQANGLATLPLGKAADVLVAKKGDDVAMLPHDVGWWGGGGWQSTTAKDSLRWHVFDDRQMYRPGEQVKVKGWLRRIGAGEGGDVAALDGAVPSVAFILRDSQGNEIARGSRPVSAVGGFDLDLKLPPTMNLGYASLELSAATSTSFAQGGHVHPFQVQEFRRPEFEVGATAPEGPHFVGGHANVQVKASYYAGGALAGAETIWRVTTRPGAFTPPNRDEWVFGTFVPWWEMRPMWGPPEPQKVESFSARTDPSGEHWLRLDFLGVNPPRPTTVVAEATVTDVNRQAWAASASLLVHPADVYVGLKSERMFVQAGEPLRIDAIVTDLDGQLVSGRTVDLVVERMDWEQVEGEWKQLAKDPQPCKLTSAGGPQRCEVTAKEGGLHRVTARVTDARGRKNQSQLTIWVAGGKQPPKRNVAEEPLTLVPDKKEYRAGDTAELLVIAPWSAGEGVVTLRRSGIIRVERFHMQGASHTVKVKIEEGWTPNVHVQVDLVGAAPRPNDEGEVDEKLPKRPAFARGSLSLSVPPGRRTLAVAVEPKAKKLEPGGETSVAVTVRDAAGQPVAGSEVALVVVDEAVLALSGYQLADPMSVFYAAREPGAVDHHLRASILLANPDDALARSQAESQARDSGVMAVTGQAPGGGGFGGPMPPAPPAAAAPMEAKRARGANEPAQPIAVRTNFDALAFFAASLPTDAAGHAEVKVKLPDNLTRYRVMAVAAARANEFGKGESTITARLPLMVRPSPPRFLNFGDELELPVVVQNQTDQPMQVDVAVRAENATLTAGRGRRLTIAANDRVEVRFPAAAREAGRARFQVGAVSGKWADAAEFDLPVWTPATTEAFATYGTVDEAGAVAQPILPPGGVVKEFGGLEITTSSTALQALTDAVLYLQSYPFECSEQVASRMLSIAALKDVLTAFQAEGLPAPEEMIAGVRRDVERLSRLQNEDGGFAFWRRGDESWPYLSIHVANALVTARQKGFDVPAAVLDRSKAYLRDVERRIPSYYGKEERRTLVAYALSVRKRMGDGDPARARRLLEENGGLEKASLEALGWILTVIPENDAIVRHFGNRVSETAGAAHFTVAYGDGAHLLLASDRRADAIILDALIGAQPHAKSAADLIPKIVAGLLAHRKAGRWGNTQENVFILLALDRYFNTYEKVTPDFVARAWLGDRYAGEHAFRGRTTERHHVDIPMAALFEAGKTNLTLAKDGKGRMYYRIGMQYAPADLKLPPYDAGFTVERAYEAVDDPNDVRRDEGGTWHVKSGARVRVKLTMVAPSRRYHVALVDPLPAGLEALNPALKVTGAIPPGPDPTVAVTGGPGLGGPRFGGHWWIWFRPWYDHQNLRDERVEAFSALVWEGVWSYSYVARATTPGKFVVPPPKAEEMYAPETFGRGAGDRLVVE